MTQTDITFIILFSLPAYVAMMCGLYLSRMLYLKENPFRRLPFIMTIVMYFVSMLVWFSRILYYVLPEVYVTLHSFLFMTCLLIYILSYRFVFEITKVSPSEKFSFFHFLTPLSGFIVMQVWSFFVPREVQLSLVSSDGVAVDGFKWFSLFFSSEIPLLLCLNVIYSALGLRRIANYRKVIVNYSADEYRGSLNWLYQFIIAKFAFFVGLGAIYAVSRTLTVNIWLLATPSMIAVFKYIILVHNILLENFVVISTDQTDFDDLSPFPEFSDDDSVAIEGNELLQSINEKSALAIRNLEEYIRKTKPFLNPRFKITDMTRALNTNRTSLSSLINRVYGVNFSRFINRLRLKELAQIKSSPANKNLSEEELVMKAGFSDFRGYLRVKYREELNSFKT